MIEARGLTVTFGRGTPLETVALAGIDLAIPAGEFVTVIGSNGAGKTTLLNAIAGEVEIDRGSLAIDGQEVTRWPAARRAALIACVFQDPLAGTCEALTVEENLALAFGRGRRRGLSLAIDRTARARFMERLEPLGLGLERRLSDRIGLLSGGQRQVVSLIMATLAPMRILLLDEHTAALDPRIAAFVLDLTRKLVAEGGLTALMVTHSMRQALDCGTRILMMHEGRVVLDIAGAERRAMDVPDLVALFERVRGERLADDALLLS
ncbi:MAG TPA: ABC transporter ATP-binding protein [Alphaproteobacteria bacterium]|nr:ABC transporter ATP-binding protein [Alphaproteobacteria bacterium]